jgi:uncharacterized protein
MKTLFKTIIGSHAYGTNIESSDIDTKSVHKLTTDEYLSLHFPDQINFDKDNVSFEVGRFLSLAQSANPTILEMLFVDDKFIQETSDEFKFLRTEDIRSKFLTKQCKNSFGGYAVAQIKKAKGQDKKMNWEKERVQRKTILDFCWVIFHNESTNIIPKWLEVKNIEQSILGLAKVNNMEGYYSIYQFDGAKGLVNADETSNQLRLSSIPEGLQPIAYLYYNQNGYTSHCKEYREYQDYITNRNTSRYVDTITHGQQIDGKNLMHCVRLINTALDIVKYGELRVFRTEREDLLKIRRGEVDLNKIITESEEKLALLDELFDKSSLPDKVEFDFVNQLTIEMRK